MRKYIIGMIMVLLMTAPLTARAEEPLDTVKSNIDKVLNVLRDPKLQGESAVAEKKDAIRRISNDMFHWRQLSKRVLAKSWDNLTPDQQQEFISLFKDILEQAYIDKILAYKDEKIDYVGNRMLSDRQAEVETRILSSDAPIDMIYRLVLIDGKWGVYDIIVEGVSLTQNYRSQFRDFLTTKSPAQLLEHLKEKVGKS